jgi:hypothetical protein
MRYIFTTLIAVLVLTLAPQICRSESGERGDLSIESAKKTLLESWKKTIKDDPGTKKFITTDDQNIYEIDTDVLPYKGRLKILNSIVEPYKPLGENDKDIIYGGVVETTLMDTTRDFEKEQPFSFSKWQHINWFDYDALTGDWFPFSKWDEHVSPEKGETHLDRIALTRPAGKNAIMDYLSIDFIDDVLILVIFGVVFRMHRRQQERACEIMQKQATLLAAILTVLTKQNSASL